jgi:hypothetical protein
VLSLASEWQDREQVLFDCVPRLNESQVEKLSRHGEKRTALSLTGTKLVRRVIEELLKSDGRDSSCELIRTPNQSAQAVLVRSYRS